MSKNGRTALGSVGSLMIMAACALGTSAGAAPSTSVAAGDTTAQGYWTVYHGDEAGSGVAIGIGSVDTSARRWTSPLLDGEIYGEPLATPGMVFVATENDTVYALSSSSGQVIWSTHVGNPVPSGDLPCGDISPLEGITGTPVVDPARQEIFAVADELVGDKPAHVLVGLSISDGKVELSQDVDPPGADPANLLQRTGLTIDDGSVVFGMGGNDGDCASYKGRVIAVPESGGTPGVFTVDEAAGDSQGAIWMGGAAPVVDSSGDIWVEAGNGSVYSASLPFDDSDSTLELSPELKLLQYFAPSSWPSDNARDLDMSTAPALLSDGEVIDAGKSRIVYLLKASDLGGIGGQEASIGPTCDEDIDGGVAVLGTTVFLPCLSGIIAVVAASSPQTLHLAWSSGIGGGPAIVAGDLVWTIGQNGLLYGLNAFTGKVAQSADIGAVSNHFPTPSVGDGLLLAPASRDVVAFSASRTTTSVSKTTTSVGSRVSTSTTKAAGTHKSGPTKPVSKSDTIAIVVLLALLTCTSVVLTRRRRPQD
jgi:outer membrane protein assembly factor BamB